MTRSERVRLYRESLSVADWAVLFFVVLVVYWGYLTLYTP